MPDHYLYNIEYSVDDIDCWLPDELEDAKDLPAIYRFEMQKPTIRLEITDEEFCDQINCDQKVVKNAMVSLDEQQLKSDLGARILLCKVKCPGNDMIVGSFEMENLGCHLDRLRVLFNSQVQVPWKPVNTPKQPCTNVIKELVQLRNDNCTTGSIHYNLRLTCFGSSASKLQVDELCCQEEKPSMPDSPCFAQAKCFPCLSTCPPKCADNEFQEYLAEINGNQLVVRVRKDSHRVTRVFDSDMDRYGREIQGDKNVVSICGCDQQIDFKFPEKLSCGDCKPKLKNCDCGPGSVLTDFQRRTSCIGKSFKNSCFLPVIRGNLKYPGRINDELIKFKLFDKCNPRDATEKYIQRPSTSHNASFQIDGQNIKRELEGKCQLPRGIQLSRKSCPDSESDVFILKIGSKKTDKQGKSSEIELEMRTPKGPDFEPKQRETREVQVDEKDFQEKTKSEKPQAVKNMVPKLKGAVPKKDQRVVPKGFVKAKK
jgi:hypothetical protein